MVSLEEAVVGIAADARAYHIKKWADDYIVKLAEYMVLPELARVTEDDLYQVYLQGYDFATAKMLKFLKGEAST